jgi:hypothetical protein
MLSFQAHPGCSLVAVSLAVLWWQSTTAQNTEKEISSMNGRIVGS